MIHICRTFASILAIFIPSSLLAKDPIFLDNDRVAFIGNTFIERAQTYGHIETSILLGSDATNLTFRNLGWSGDSVFNDARAYFGPPSEGRERLFQAVKELKPNVVFICYGTGEAMSINQPWTDEKGSLTAVVGAGLETDLIIFLNGYRELIENIKNAAGKDLREIIMVTPPPLENLGPPLPDQITNNKNLATFSKSIGELASQKSLKLIDLFSAIGPHDQVTDSPWTSNGIHYGESGYQMIANHWITVLGLNTERVAKSDFAQYSKLRTLVIEKNRLFFHRWRPANETYLFLFRKHEQGNNAKEMPMFDPLIKEKEALINQILGKSGKQAATVAPQPVAQPTVIPPTFADVPYDQYEKTKLDFWQAPGEGPRPILVNIHGGGWTSGDKATNGVKEYLKKGISFASINYRLTGEAPLPAPVHDAARAIQFIRHKAKEWNLQKDKMVLTGGSAGACTSMWLLCHDDLVDPKSKDPVERESTRVQGAIVTGGQTSIDPKQIEPWLGPNVLKHRMINMAVGEATIEGALANYSKHENLFKEFSAYNHVSKDDPPLYMSYGGDMTLPSKDAGHGIHHPVYGVKMKEKCDSVGQECYLLIPKVSTPVKSTSEFVDEILLGVSKFSIPKTDDGLPGEGPIRRYDWFSKLWSEKRKRWAKEIEKDQSAIVFLGDSITQGWGTNMNQSFGDLKVANRGISGDTTRGMLIRLQEDVLSLNPSCVVMLLGTNDLEEGADPTVIAGNFKLIISQLKKHNPKMPIIVSLVFPSSDAKKRPADKIQSINQLYSAAVKDDPQVTIVDTWKLFADTSGNAQLAEFPDLLHPNNLGYEKWAKSLIPIFSTMGFLEVEPDSFVPEPGFKSLFNGKDLTGWGYFPTPPRENPNPIFAEVAEAMNFNDLKASPDHRYRAINSKLVVATPPSGRRIQQIWTTTEFSKDFTLKLEFRATPNADSGIFIRSKQLQCRDYLLAGPYKELKSYKPQDWNEIIIKVTRTSAHCTCNGEVLEENFQIPEKGPIGLEGDMGQMEYRRIRISENAE